MALFRKRKDEEEEKQELRLRRPSPKAFKDLKPENKKKRKEPPKPWGKNERLLVLFLLAGTSILSGILALSSRGWKLPGLPRLDMSLLSFSQEPIIIEKEGEVKGEDTERILRVRSEIIEKTSSLTGVYGVYVYELESDVSWGINERERFQAASLIKLPVMLALYQDKPEGYKSMVQAMGKRSDNSVFNNAVKILGQERITEVIHGVGMTKTSLEENETTPADVGIFFRKLYDNELLKDEEKEEFLESITNTIYEEFIPKGIPDVMVAHKYGREVHVINDAGIVFSEKPFVLVIMSKGIVDKEGEEVIPGIAELVYE